ncbi:CgeB family protein [Paenibacillus ihbetae]|uniref:Spore maturation protein cgeB n=1 Tax=Paenibacillus ihbetae TaxID=1870820 RepID=A0ABX3JS68_9BACL|nr:glycosyltransferase [Paenibacillus ihbetae]OOC58374.1 spore maturation protein cgeB [Paenibacillus ihbetae]
MPRMFAAGPKRAAADAYQQGRSSGLHQGYMEGYFRGKSQGIVNRVVYAPPLRNLHVLFVSSGKGFPYSPIDEAIIATLHTMVTQVTVSDAKQDVAAEASRTRPDLVLVLDGMYMPVDQMDAIRSMGLRTAVWMTDDPYYTDISVGWIHHYDYIFTLELNCVVHYQNLGCAQVHYLPFGAFPIHYRPIAMPAAASRDIGFVGTAYPKRIRFFEPIMDHLMRHRTFISGNWWERLPGYARFNNRIEVNKWMGPADTADVYNSAKIIINLHRAVDDDDINQNSGRIPAASPNPRTFEINACGTLQLVDEREDMARFYTPGIEIETYRSQSELLEKIEYYLANDQHRKDIAHRALERTYQEHTYAHRLNTLLSVIFP